MSLPIVIRYATADDVPFMVSAWVRTYTDSDAAKHLMNDSVLRRYQRILDPKRPQAPPYYALQTALVNNLLATSVSVVAAFEEDINLLMGFACGDPALAVLHYVAVKPAYKRNGVASALVEALGFDKSKDAYYTHITEKGNKAVAKNWIYKPELLCGTK